MRNGAPPEAINGLRRGKLGATVMGRATQTVKGFGA